MTWSSSIGEEIPAGWVNGPVILSRPEERWPNDLPWLTTGDELRSKETLSHLQVKPDCPEVERPRGSSQLH